jgi:Carboxypeptidase regulatory-like domain
MKMNRASKLATMVFGLLALGVVPAGSRGAPFAQATAWGQNIAGQRKVTGTVLNAGSQPVVGAIVFLKNEKTKAIRSYTTTADGHFHFAQIDMSVDFDLWAEKDGKKSATKTVSSWDERKVFVADLKLK